MIGQIYLENLGAAPFNSGWYDIKVNAIDDGTKCIVNDNDTIRFDYVSNGNRALLYATEGPVAAGFKVHGINADRSTWEWAE